MDRKEMIELMRLQESGSSYINRKGVAIFLGYKDPHCVDKFLVGLERIGMKYFIPDVVDSVRQETAYR